jgi:O-antigen ligase
MLLCASALLEQIPQASLRTAIFVAALVCYFGMALWDQRAFARRSALDVLLIGFLTAVILSGLWAVTASNVAVADAVRGAIPFLFLGLFFLVDRRDPCLIPKLSIYLARAATIWIFSILIEGFYLLLVGEFVAAARLTSQISQSVIPFGLAVLPFLVIGNVDWSWLRRLALVVAVFLVALFAGYRSQSILMVFQFAVFFAVSARDVPRLLTLLAAVMAMGVSAVVVFPDLVNALIDRLSATNADFESSRLAEWSYALSQFEQSPVIGMGIGWQVPFEVTFDGSLEQLLSSGMELASTAGYVHSVSAYFLMDMGLVGFILYFGALTAALWQGVRRTRFYTSTHPVSRGALCAALSLVTLVLFFQVQASFRLIQSNLLLVCLLLMLSAPTLGVRMRPRLNPRRGGMVIRCRRNECT